MSFCFSHPREHLTDEEKTGRYGSLLGPYADFDTAFDVSMSQAPCEAPICCCMASLCPCPSLVYMRYRALNHVYPHSGWSKYKCCQGYWGGFQCGDQCPFLCMSLEACCSPALAATTNSLVLREHYHLGLDEDDVSLLRRDGCFQCLQICVCATFICCVCASLFLHDGTGFQGTPHSSPDDCIADVMVCCCIGCTTAQLEHEIQIREITSFPNTMEMDR